MGAPAAHPRDAVTEAPSVPAGPTGHVRFGRETTGMLADAESLEWLVPNGIGGYGSGTVAGSVTRGYHGLLVAARQPPVDRRPMLVKLDETATYRDQTFELATNRCASGAVAPTGNWNLDLEPADRVLLRRAGRAGRQRPGPAAEHTARTQPARPAAHRSATPRGGIAQAWSVAEVLGSYTAIERLSATAAVP
ncbi:MAG: glycogen debranching enzyme N-terminal domain-containing protein [Dermatophilaceae bacterium]